MELFGVLNLFANFMPALVAVIKKDDTPGLLNQYRFLLYYSQA